MSNEKKEIIIRSIDDYKKLPEASKMFVLGYMQGVLSSQKDKKAQAV